ncbi:type II toxin-antitoxin system RelE/ParE family toxin [Acidisoma silvae]|uniref:Type II toxin-antitoxin system RelE/ParE family toxin n=1 Tax=Acidisoma silvae TaxID=2802396 RepID=A0A964E0I4_9PROT|nr:type II toxin-antitoxin system RelE/ParE family toxin [Acidisoma silvae]
MELRSVFAHLAQFPSLGRPFRSGGRRYWRFEHRSHIIFYRQDRDNLRIMRILHRRQRPETYI